MSRFFISIVTLLLVASGVSACGSDTSKSGSPPVDIVFDSGSTTPDGNDAGTTETDAGEDAGTDAASEVPPGCIANNFDFDSAVASRTASSLSVVATKQRPNDNQTDELFFVHRTSDPQTGTVSIDDSSFAECTNCLTIQTGCSEAGCEATYMALSGSLELLEVAGNYRARASDLTFEPVSIDETGATTVLEGDAYCVEELDISAPIETNPCSEWPEPSLADVNCGEAPLTVTFNVSGFEASSDDFSYLSIDFGDGESFYSSSESITTHTFQAGDWDVEIESVGYIDGNRVTLTTPETIRAY